MFGDKDDILEIIFEKKHVANSPIRIILEATEKIDFCFDSNFSSPLTRVNTIIKRFPEKWVWESVVKE